MEFVCVMFVSFPVILSVLVYDFVIFLNVLGGDQPHGACFIVSFDNCVMDIVATIWVVTELCHTISCFRFMVAVEYS